MKKIKIIFQNILLLCFVICFSFGAIQDYKFKRELLNVNNKWQKIILPTDIYQNISDNFNDVRIYKIISNKDTSEVPYLLKILDDNVIEKNIKLKLLNESYNKDGKYFFITIPKLDTINTIDLEFYQTNYDWKVKVEGSYNLKEWFTIVDDYRILSIQNDYTDYEFNSINFKTCNFKYYRLQIKNTSIPKLKSISSKIVVIKSADMVKYEINSFDVKNDTKNKLTIINASLKYVAPINKVKVIVDNDYDYHRLINISTYKDSINNNANFICSFYLSSLSDNIYPVNNVHAKYLKLIISNLDNVPVNIKEIKVVGSVHQLIARFDKEDNAKYFLVYGNKNAFSPSYDLKIFENKIPEDIASLSLQDEENMHAQEDISIEPLFKNKLWLWLVLVTVIIILGWFSLKMIRQK